MTLIKILNKYPIYNYSFLKIRHNTKMQKNIATIMVIIIINILGSTIIAILGDKLLIRSTSRWNNCGINGDYDHL